MPNNKVEYKRLRSADVNGQLPLLQLVPNEIPSVDPDLPYNIENGHGVGLGILNKPHYNNIVSNYRDFFCRRCLRYACLLHRIQQPLPRNRVDPKPPFPCKLGKFTLPSDLIRDHRRSVSVLNDPSKPLLFTAKSGELIESSINVNHINNSQTNSSTVCNTSRSNNLRTGSGKAMDPSSYDGAYYYNSYEDRVPKDDINPNNFYFSDFVMVYMSPVTKRDEIFVPSTSLASFPTLLNSINARQVTLPQTVDDDATRELSASRSDTGKAVSMKVGSTTDIASNSFQQPNSVNLQVIQPTMLKSDPILEKATLQSLFKAKLPLHGIDRGESGKLNPRSGKGSNFVAVNAITIVDTSKIEAEKQRLKTSFVPPLTDAELGIISRLSHMFAFYKPYVSPPILFSQSNSSHATSPTPSSTLGISSFQSRSEVLEDAFYFESMDGMIDFIYNTLVTRNKDEIRLIIEQRHVLFPKTDEEVDQVNSIICDDHLLNNADEILDGDDGRRKIKVKYSFFNSFLFSLFRFFE